MEITVTKVIKKFVANKLSRKFICQTGPISVKEYFDGNGCIGCPSPEGWRAAMANPRIQNKQERERCWERKGERYGD